MHQTLLIDEGKFTGKIIETEEMHIDHKNISQNINDYKYKEDLMAILEDLDDIEKEY